VSGPILFEAFSRFVLGPGGSRATNLVLAYSCKDCCGAQKVRAKFRHISFPEQLSDRSPPADLVYFPNPLPLAA
jgi:hypothetical protein